MVIKYKQLLFFMFGFVIGVSIFTFIFTINKTENYTIATKTLQTHSEVAVQSVFNELVAESLFDEVKILCMIMTNPKNHKLKAIHVKNTWGKKCNKLLFITSQEDPEFDTIVVQVNESRNALRKKCKTAFLYAHDNHLNDFDWFMKADEDSFVLMENLRYLLYQYRPQTSLLFGHRFNLFKGKAELWPEGYMAGGAYVLSRKALEKFAVIVRANPKKFFYPDGAGEDLMMGKALAHSAIFVDCRDEYLRRRFFPLQIPPFRTGLPPWYTAISYYNVSETFEGCCSDVPILFHYTNRTSMYRLNYLFYHVHPFGLEKAERRDLPRKLSLNEIISASDARGFASRFVNHTDYHNMTSSEYF